MLTRLKLVILMMAIDEDNIMMAMEIMVLKLKSDGNNFDIDD